MAAAIEQFASSRRNSKSRIRIAEHDQLAVAPFALEELHAALHRIGEAAPVLGVELPRMPAAAQLLRLRDEIELAAEMRADPGDDQRVRGPAEHPDFVPPAFNPVIRPPLFA